MPLRDPSLDTKISDILASYFKILKSNQLRTNSNSYKKRIRKHYLTPIDNHFGHYRQNKP